MEYPVSNATFNQLLHTRQEMVRLSSSSGNVDIAWPFVPFVGKNILKGNPGIYFIGIATREEWKESKNLAGGRKISCEQVRGPNSTGFWRYLRAVSETVFGQPFEECIESIAWSNQFKIGLRKGNPSGAYAKAQLHISRSILKRELRLASRCAIVFLGDVDAKNPVLPEYFDRDNAWDVEKYRKHGVWVKNEANGALVLYQYHPRAFSTSGINFNEQVATCAQAIKQHLNRQAHKGRDLAEVLSRHKLLESEARAWHRDLRSARRKLKAPANRWR